MALQGIQNQRPGVYSQYDVTAAYATPRSLGYAAVVAKASGGETNTLYRFTTAAQLAASFDPDGAGKTLRGCVQILLQSGVAEVLAVAVDVVMMHLATENKRVGASGRPYRALAYQSQRVRYNNGGRDGFVAALVWAHMQGFGFEEGARAGVAAASMSATDGRVVNNELNEDRLLAALGK